MTKANTAPDMPRRHAPSAGPTEPQHILDKRSQFSNVLIPPLAPTAATPCRRSTHTLACTPPLSTLLKHNDSFTRALECQLASGIRARLLGRHTRPLPSAWHRSLKADACGLWQVRTTTLLGDTHVMAGHFGAEQPLIFAQTLIPRRTLQHFGKSLLNCKNQPIGNILFQQRHAPARTWLFHGKLPAQRLPAAIRQLTHSPTLWLRQSLLMTRPKPVVITEIFLPALLHLLEENALHSRGALNT